MSYCTEQSHGKIYICICTDLTLNIHVCIPVISSIHITSQKKQKVQSANVIQIS